MMLGEVIAEWGSDGTIIDRVALLTTWVISWVQNIVALREAAWCSETNMNFWFWFY